MTALIKKVQARGFTVVLAISLLAGCGGTGDSSDSVTVAGDVPIAYVKRSDSIRMNPLTAAGTGSGGDLYVREKSSPSASEYNITSGITQGSGDVSDPEVSYDGRKIVFALRCPTTNTSTIGGQLACTGRWNIWEYDMSTAGRLNQGTLRRITSSNQHDDVDPAYLPGGRGFVFSSNRQTKSLTMPVLGQTYKALDEYEREQVINLHTMDANGNNIEQISFNQSHDRNPVVLQNGRIMFSRWDHVGGRNHFAIFQAKPDGTDMFVLYGSHSDGNSFLHPREMDPNGAYRGRVTTSLMPLSGTQEGGALMIIDITNYSEQNTPANSSVPQQGGQTQATAEPINTERGLSLSGRVTTPYPLWDGTNRVLAAYTPCQVTKDGRVVPCAMLTAAEIDRLNSRDRLAGDVQADNVQDNVPPAYGIYMFDPAKQTWRVVVPAQAGFIFTDPIPLQARAEPNVIEPTQRDTVLAGQNMGLLEVRSVYDTDGLGRMSDPMLAAADLPGGCSTAIVKTTPADPEDTRAQVADIVRIKNPADAAYNCRPARFMRFTRAVPPPSGSQGLRRAIGETDFEMQQVLGYADVEPDGSFKVRVPADTPLAITVVDAKGRAFQSHTNWIQVRPGETRTCDGCHSPRRGAAINSGSIAGNHPNTLMAGLELAGETMAGTRTRLNTSALNLKADMEFTDVWAAGGTTPTPPISIRYDQLATTAPVNGVINYPDHIQPLWARDRGSNTCTSCHSDPALLDLRAGAAGTGRLTSYEELMVGDPVIDSATGLPQTRVENGVVVIVRGAALVDVGASEGQAVGLSRKSRLMEILSGEDLLSGAEARTAHPTPTTVNHAGMLSAAELRLVAEWIDLGGQYYNNPFDSASGVRSISGLSEQAFESDVLPILRTTCAASCHQAVGSDPTIPPGTTFQGNRFVLTGNVEGDYNATLAMINDACNPASNYLLSRPSTIPHPSTLPAGQQTQAVLPVGSAGYNTISAWIQSGCAGP